MSNDKTDLLARIAPPPAYPRASTAAPDGGITWPEDPGGRRSRGCVGGGAARFLG